MHMHMHWRLSPLHWLFQSEPRRKYSSTTMTCIVQNSLLKIIRLQSEVKSKRFLRTQQVQNLGIGNSYSSTMSYMAYYPIIPRRKQPSEGKRLDSTIMRSREHFIADRMMESYFVAFRTKRHRKPSEKLTMVRAELINLALNLEISYEDLATTGQRWFLMLSPTLSGVILVRSMVISFTKHGDIFIQRLLHGHLRCGK